MELFALQIEHMGQTGRQQATGRWTKVDRERLKAIRDFIETNYLQPLTLGQITQQFGISAIFTTFGCRKAGSYSPKRQ